MYTRTPRRIGLFAALTLLAVALLALNVAVAGAATSTSQLQRAPFVAAGTRPAPAPGDGGTITAIGPVVAATNPVLERAPFVAVPIAPLQAEAAVASAAVVAGFDGASRTVLGAPVPGPLVVNAAPLSAATGLAVFGGALLAMILIAGASVLLTYGRYRPQAELGAGASVAGLDRRQAEGSAEADQPSRRKAA